MKKQLLSLVCAIAVSTVVSFGQPLKNAGFELWVPQTGYEDPQDWTSLNLLSNPIFTNFTPPYNPVSCFKSTDKHSGTYAMRVKTVKLYGNPVPAFLNDTCGGVFNGTVNFAAGNIKFGYADTTRVGSMKFWSKYTPVGNDTAYVTILLQRHNPLKPNKPDTVGRGTVKIYGTVSTYTEFIAPVTYEIDTLPDTITVAFAASGPNKPQVGSELLVDDVSYTIAVGVGEKTKNNIAVNVFPNPASSIVNFSVINAIATSVQVFDMKGSFVTSLPIEPSGSAKLNVQNLANGVYTYKLVGGDNAVLTSGKFTVEK